MENNQKLIQAYFMAGEGKSTHYHLNPELFYVLEGKIEAEIDDQQFVMQRGDILLVNANKRHALAGSEDLTGARFEIDYHLLSEAMGTMQYLFWCNSVLDRNEAYDQLRQLLNLILADEFEKDPHIVLHQNALYYQTLHVLVSNFLVRSDDSRLPLASDQDRERIRSIQNYIQGNYQSQISLNDLAEKLYLSNAYLSKYIKKNLGCTFLEYLNNIRLFHAVDELLYTQKNITRIAMDNGFPNSAAFTKSFREAFGSAPSEYRRRIQNEARPREEDPVLSQEQLDTIQRQIEQRLHGQPDQHTPRTRIRVDAARQGTPTANNFRAVCFGEVYTLLHSDAQKQLLELAKGAGIVYVRFWNVFSREHCFFDGEMNFRKLDMVLDFLLENSMKPYFELGSKTNLILYSAMAPESEQIPVTVFDTDTFIQAVRKLLIHLINRYGLEEMETWRFEYWCSSDTGLRDRLVSMGQDGIYYQNFEALWKTLKSFSPDLLLGGPGFALGYEMGLVQPILQAWKQREIRPDFLSVYMYQYVSYEENGNYYGRKSIDPGFMKNQLEIFRQILQEEDFDLPVHITEWNFTISNRNLLNDSCEQGAYVLKNCIDMNGQCALMAYWHALDSYSDSYDASSILNGDSGLISRDGLHKPAFYALSFMNELLPAKLYQDDCCIVTSNRRDSFAIACHNYKKLSSQFAFCDDEEITKEELFKYVEDEEPKALRFCLQGLRDGTYVIRQSWINRNTGSVQDIWKRLGYERSLSRSEMEYLEHSAIPWMETDRVQVKGGRLETDCLLADQEIRLVKIQYEYS